MDSSCPTGHASGPKGRARKNTRQRLTLYKLFVDSPAARRRPNRSSCMPHLTILPCSSSSSNPRRLRGSGDSRHAIRRPTVFRGHAHPSDRTAYNLHTSRQSGPAISLDFSKLTFFFSRYLSQTMQMRVLNPALLPTILRSLRATLFPNNALAPPRRPPSNGEAMLIKRRCAATLLDLLPARVATIFFASASRDEQLCQTEELLDCLDDAYLNKHLVFAISELIVLRLVPELGERGVQELMDERLG